MVTRKETDDEEDRKCEKEFEREMKLRNLRYDDEVNRKLWRLKTGTGG
jgi:hypothetical protein